MLKILGVSLSGYRAWQNRKPSNTQQRRAAVKVKIMDIYDDSKQSYGALRITKRLQQEGEIISERTVGKYMSQLGIKAQWAKPWAVTTKDSNFSNELQNILNEQFNPERPNAVWCSDITYIWTTEGFTYQTSIMDLFSRKIIAWTSQQLRLKEPYCFMKITSFLTYLYNNYPYCPLVELSDIVLLNHGINDEVYFTLEYLGIIKGLPLGFWGSMKKQLIVSL